MDTGKKTIAEIGALAKQKGKYADMDDISAGKLLLEEYPEYWFHISDGEKSAKDVMSVDEFGRLIKSKKPEYADKDDRDAAMTVLGEYPAYWRTVVEKKSPGGIGSARGSANGYANDMPNNPIRPVSVMPEEYWGLSSAQPSPSIEGDPATKGGKPVSVMPDEQMPAPSKTPEEIGSYFESDEYKAHVAKMDNIAGPVYERNVEFLDQVNLPEGEELTPGYKKKVEAEVVGDGKGRASYRTLYENDFIDKLMESPEFKDLDDKQRYEARMYLDSKVRGRDLEQRIDEEMKRSFKARGVEFTDEGGIKILDDISKTIQSYNDEITKVKTSLALTTEEARKAIATDWEKSTVRLEGLKAKLEAAVATGGITLDEANVAIEQAYKDDLDQHNRFVRSQNAYIEKVYSDTKRKYENKLKEQLTPLKAKAAAAGIDIGEDGSIVAERLLKEVTAGTEMKIKAEEQLRKLRGYAGMSGGEKWKAALTSGVGDMVQTIAGAYLNKGYYEMGESLRRAAKSMQFEDFPELPEFTFSQSLVDPAFWMTKGVRMLPFTLALMAPAIATGGVAGVAAGALGAGAVTSAAISAGAATAMSRPLESLMEGGGRYLEVLEKGGSVEEAQKEFAYVNSRNYALLMSDFIQFGAIFLPGGAAFKVGALMVGSALEGGEEVYQEWINKRAGDRDYALIEFMKTPEAKEVFALGTANGLAFEALGLLNSEGKEAAERRKLYKKKMRESLAIMLAHGEGLVVRKKQLANMMDVQLLNGIITKEQYKDALKVLDKVASDLQAFTGKDDSGTRSQFLELMHNLADINSRMENASPEAKEVLKAQKAEAMKEIEALRAGTAPGYFVDDVYYSKEDFLTLLNDGKFLEEVSRPGHRVEVRNDEEVEAIMTEKVGAAMDRNVTIDRGAASDAKAPLVTLSEEGAATMASIDKGEAVSSESAINLLSELKAEREALEARKAAKDRVYTTREYDAMIAVIDDEMAAANEAITVGTAENVAAKETEEVSPGIVSQEVEDVIAGMAENKEASIADLKKASKAILKESRRISKDKNLRKSLGNPVVNKEAARLKDVLEGLSSRIDEMEAVAQEEAAKAKELEGTEGKVEEASAEEKRDDSEDIIEPSVTYDARKKAVQSARKEFEAAEAAVESYESLSEEDQARAIENLEAAAKRLERAEKAFDKAIKEEAPAEVGEGAEKVKSGIAQSVKMTVSDSEGVRSAKFTQKIKAKPSEEAPVRRYKTYDDPREFAEDFDIKEGQAGALSAGRVNVKELFVNKNGAFVSVTVDGNNVIIPVGKDSPVLKEVQAVELTEKGEKASKRIRTKGQVFRAVKNFFKGTDEQAEFASGFIAQMAKARARRFGRPVEDYFQGMVFVSRAKNPIESAADENDLLQLEAATDIVITGDEEVRDSADVVSTVSQSDDGGLDYTLDDIKGGFGLPGSRVVSRALGLANGIITYKAVMPSTGKKVEKVEKVVRLPFRDAKAERSIKAALRKLDAVKGSSVEARAQREKIKKGLQEAIVQFYENYVSQMSETLRGLFDTLTPEFVEYNKQWYDGANRFATAAANRYNVSLEQASAITAILSPQQDWNNNISMAERVMHIMSEMSDIAMTREMVDKVSGLIETKPGKSSFPGDLRAMFETYGEVSINDLLAKGVKSSLVAIYLRGLDQALNVPDVINLAPDGHFSGNSAWSISWASSSMVGRAISVYLDGSKQNISEKLGNGNKVRNFYNNIASPNSEVPSVTVDTHAASAVFMLPLSASDAVAINLFMGGKEPVYAMIKEAYIRVAKDVGLKPRELQSVLWEAQRSGVNNANRTRLTKERVSELSNELEEKGVSAYERAIRISNENRSEGLEYAERLGFMVQRGIPELLQALEETRDEAGRVRVPVRSERGGPGRAGASVGLRPAGDVVRPKGTELFHKQGGKWYYSPTEVALGKISQDRGTPEQFRAMLLKNGAKQAELNWLGFDEAFAGQKTISRQDIRALIDENRINIEEVQLGGDLLALNNEEEALAALEAGYQLEDAEGIIIDVSGASVLDQLAFPLSVVDYKTRTKYESYQTPGGKNYKEVLFTLPLKGYKTEKQIAEDLEKIRIYNLSFIDMVDYLRSIGQPTPEEVVIAKRYLKAHEDARDALPEEAKIINGQATYMYGDYHRNNFRGRHFNDFLNVAVHVRFNERVNSEGKPVLFIEEIQSDWAQKGRIEGFEGAPVPLRDINGNVVVPDTQAWENKVPDMPFKKTDQWVKLALRRMLQYAVENGFDQVAWTTGEMQAERYKDALVREIEAIEPTEKSLQSTDSKRGLAFVAKKGNGLYLEVDESGKVTYQGAESGRLGNIVGKDLSEVIGKDGAEQAMSAELDKEFKTKDIVIKSEGMKAFYDKIIPSAVLDISKGIGARVEDITLEGGGKSFTVKSIALNDQMRGSFSQAQPLYHRDSSPNMAAVAPVTKSTFTSRGENIMNLYHYSTDPNVMTEGVDPRYFGRNAVTSDRRRYGVSFYYTSPNPERVIGGNVHVVTVDKSKVYDLSKDELNVVPKIEQKIREYEKKNRVDIPMSASNIADFSRFVLSDMGYIGIVTDWRAVMANGKAEDLKRVELYEKQEVNIAATNSYNRFHSVTPSAADVMRDIEMRASNIVRGLSSNSGMYDVVKNAIRQYYGASADVYSVPESAFLDPRVYKAISVASEPHLAKIFEEYKAYIDEYKIARAASSGHSEVSGLGAAETLYQVAGADSYTKETSAVGASDTQSFGTYNEALEAHPGLSQRNIHVKQGKGANGGRVLAIQLSSPNMIEAMRNGRMHRSDRVFDEYYDAIYNNVDGYDRTIDFMELPFWIAEMAGSMNGKLDMYVSRDNAESSRFLETSGYKKVAMSVMDVNLNMVLDMVKNNPGTRFYLGGYVENMDKVFAPYKNAVTIGSIKAGVEAAGFSYTGKYDYSMFRGTAIIPRLKMSSGCKHKCAFCTIPKKVIPESKSSVMQQVKALDGLNARYVYLDDKTFGQADNWESLVEVGDALAAQNPSFEGFIIQTTSASIINIDRKDPSFFSRGRIKYAEIGVETNNDYLLKELHKPNRERLNDLAASILRERGVKFIPNVIIGIEGETRESYENTMDYIRRNSDIISHLNVYNLALYEGTELHDKLGVKTDADRNEDILEKSFHSDPALHTEYYFRMFELGKELALGLGKEESPLGAMYDQMTSRVEAGEPLASIQFSDGNAFVTAFKGANIVSFFHEVAGHYTFEDILSVINDDKLSPEVRSRASEELKVVVDAYNKNVKAGILSDVEYSSEDVFSNREAYVSVHEFFANGFIRWMVDSGSSHDPALVKVFKRFAEWVRGLFEGLKGEGIRLTPELEALYRDVSNIDYAESEINPNAVTNEKALVVDLVDKFQVPSSVAKAIGKIAEYSAGRSVVSAMDETKEAWYARNYDLLTRLYTEEFTSSPLSNVSDRDFVNKARYVLGLLGSKKSSRITLVKPYVDSVFEAAMSGNESAKILTQKFLDSYNGTDGDPVAINDLADESTYNDFLRFMSDVFYAYDGETIKSKKLNLITRLIGPGFRNQSFSPDVIAAISDLRGFVQEAVSLATESGVINSMPYSAITGIRRLEGFSGISEASYNRNRSKAKAMFDLFDRRTSVSNPKKSPLTKDGWFIISNLYDAGTEAQKAANKESFNFKLAELASRGYMYMRLKDGVYDGVTNPSWIIFGLSAKEAISIGREFKQESILTKDGIVYNNGGYANKVDVIYYGKKIPERLSEYKSTFVLHDGSELDMSMGVQDERTPVEGLATRKGLVRNYGVQDEAGRIAVNVSPEGRVSLGAIGDGETMYYPDGAIYPVSEDPYGYGATAEKEFGAVDKKKGVIMIYVPGEKGVGSSFVIAINSLLGDSSGVKVEIREGQKGEYVVLTGKSRTPINQKVSSDILAQLDKYYAGAYYPIVITAKDEEMSSAQKLSMTTAYARDNGFSGVLVDSGGEVVIDAWEPPHSSVDIKGPTLFHAKKRKSIPVEKQNTGQQPSMTPQEINENMTRQVKAAKAEANARAVADKISNKLGTYIFDRGFVLKWAVEQAPGEAADVVKKRLNQVRRAQAIASYQISQAFDKVLGAPSLLGKGKVLNKGERSMLGRYLNLVRIIELDALADKESRARLTHTFVEDPASLDGGGVTLNKESAELIVEAMKNGDQDILASFGLKPGYDFARIENAAKEYWMVMEEQIKALLDEGVITQAAYDKMAAEGKYYSPRLFIEKLEEAVDTGRAATSRTGIHNLQEGSTGNLSEDVQLSLSRKISGTQFAISQAKLGRAMADFLNQNAVSWGYIAEYHPEFIEALNREIEARLQASLAGIKRPYKYIEPRWVSPRPGYRAITYIRSDSSKGRVYLANDLADVYEGVNDTPMHLWDTIGTIMLTKVLKAAATGYNPEFLVRNVPLDVLHILMTQNIYGKTVTFGALKMLKDVFYAPAGQHSVFRDVMLRTGQVLDYYATGGYNQTLGYESRQWYKDKKDNRTAAGEAIKSIGAILAYLGESSELITRVALRRRYINAYKKDAARQGRVLSDKDLRELESDATEFAIGYLDFSQGGSAIKAVDKFIPYLNAATQVTYGTLRAVRRDPVAYAAKLTELSMYSILIGGWNLGLFAPLLKGLFDDEEEYNKYEEKIKERARFYTDNIDDRIKAGNWILMTNWKFVADDGQQKYVYFKIPKDISVQPILGTIEGAFMSAITKDDKYLVSGQRLKEFQNMISVIDISSLPPLMKAILNYTNNKDLYYSQDIWRGIEVEPYMEYYIGKTPPLYVELGDALNMSPVRLENAINQVITKNNTFYSLAMAGTTLMLDDMPAPVEKDEEVWESITQGYFLRRVMATTNYNKDRQVLTQLTMKRNTVLQKIDNYIKQAMAGKTGAESVDQIDKVAQNMLDELFVDGMPGYVVSPFDFKRAVRKLVRRSIERQLREEYVQKGRYDYRIVLSMYYGDVPRAEYIYNLMREVGPEKSMEVYEAAAELPGYITDEFIAVLSQLDEANGTKFLR